MQIKGMKLSHTLQWKICQVTVLLADLQVYTWFLELNLYRTAVVSDLVGGSTSLDFILLHNRRHPSSRGSSSPFLSFVSQSVVKGDTAEDQALTKFSSCSSPREPTYCLLATIFRSVWFARAYSCCLDTRKILTGLTKCVSYITPSKDRTLITRKCKIARII